QRFEATDNFAVRHGYSGAFPNFQQAIYASPPGLVYGTILINSGAADRVHIKTGDFLSELGGTFPTSVGDAFIAVDRYAQSHGYVGGFLNGEESVDAGGDFFGAVLVKPTFPDGRVVAVRMDIKVSDLFALLKKEYHKGDEISSPDERFRAVDEYILKVLQPK